VGLPIVLTVFFGAPDIVYLFYGPKWAPSTAFLRFLVICAMAAPFVELSIWLSTAKGHTRTTLFITGAEAITIVIVATPLTWRFGAMGTVAGVGLTSAVGLVLSCRYVFRQVPLKLGEVFAAPLLATAVATGVLIILWNIPGFVSQLPLLRLALTGSVGSGVFFVVSFIMRPQETLERLRYIGQTWRKAPATQSDSISG
jgi:O-antigen/teichoic acid export membrane protein